LIVPKPATVFLSSPRCIARTIHAPAAMWPSKWATGRFSERFSREVRAVASLNHASICTLYDVGPDFLVMESVSSGFVGATHDRRFRALDSKTGKELWLTELSATVNANPMTYQG
jgi:serine/threonine protein kinase